MSVSRQLIWPAAAGNILWAALTLLSEQIKSKELSRPEDYLTIIVLFIYLSENFLAGRELKFFDGKKNYEKFFAVVFEYFHIILICLVGILTYLNFELTDYAVALIFVVVLLMHAFGLSPNSKDNRLAYALTGFFGLVFLLSSNCFSATENFSAFISIFFSLMYWGMLRKCLA